MRGWGECERIKTDEILIHVNGEYYNVFMIK